MRIITYACILILVMLMIIPATVWMIGVMIAGNTMRIIDNLKN